MAEKKGNLGAAIIIGTIAILASTLILFVGGLVIFLMLDLIIGIVVGMIAKGPKNGALATFLSGMIAAILFVTSLSTYGASLVQLVLGSLYLIGVLSGFAMVGGLIGGALRPSKIMKKPKNRIQYLISGQVLASIAIVAIASIIVCLLLISFSNNNSRDTNSVGFSCFATPGWLCNSPVLSHKTGSLSFVLGQNNGYQIGNIMIACAAASNTLGLPVATGITSSNVLGYNGFYIVQSDGVSNTLAVPGATLPSGSTITIKELPCFQANGTAFPEKLKVNTPFQGAIWIGFNSSGSNGSINTLSKIATISVKAS